MNFKIRMLTDYHCVGLQLKGDVVRECTVRNFCMKHIATHHIIRRAPLNDDGSCDEYRPVRDSETDTTNNDE